MDPSPPHSVLVTGLWALVSSVSALIMLLLSALITVSSVACTAAVFVQHRKQSQCGALGWFADGRNP
jgi:hypothetical protein